jgi:heme/copper-type cytochrome/quinol oxidase subunit 2
MDEWIYSYYKLHSSILQVQMGGKKMRGTPVEIWLLVVALIILVGLLMITVIAGQIIKE